LIKKRYEEMRKNYKIKLTLQILRYNLFKKLFFISLVWGPTGKFNY
jgi:hypothetical protein